MSASDLNRQFPRVESLYGRFGDFLRHEVNGCASFVSDRMKVGQDVLDKHYDKRDEEVKVEQRRGKLDSI